MKTYCCKECKELIDRERELYNNSLIQDPLWLHLKECNEELFRLMADFDNPYDIECLYTEAEQNEENFIPKRRTR